MKIAYKKKIRITEPDIYDVYIIITYYCPKIPDY